MTVVRHRQHDRTRASCSTRLDAKTRKDVARAGMRQWAIVTSVANLSYSISGSSFSIPNDAFSFSITLPPMTNGVPTLAYAQLQLVSAARMDYLRSNIGFLPPTPFAMTVTVTVQGQSDAGGTFLSNPITYNVTFTD